MILSIRRPMLLLALLTGCAGHSSPSMTAPVPDPRVGLRAGWFDAQEVGWNVRLVSNTPPSDPFINRASPGDFALLNSDLSFVGPYAIQGNFSGYQVWDVSHPEHPVLHTSYICPGSQSDVSVYRTLMFVSGEALNAGWTAAPRASPTP